MREIRLCLQVIRTVNHHFVSCWKRECTGQRETFLSVLWLAKNVPGPDFLGGPFSAISERHSTLAAAYSDRRTATVRRLCRIRV